MPSLDRTTWITHPQAAEILCVHLTAAGKMVERGELHPRQEH